MFRQLLLICLLIICSFFSFSQQSEIIAGPMLGPVELRDAKIWLEVSQAVKSVSLKYKKRGDVKIRTILYKGQLGNEINPLQIVAGGLDINSTYEYWFLLNGKPSTAKGEFTTKDLWQYRKPAPDFSFLTGSCAYFNQPVYDRPGKPYGGDSSIFETMAKEKAAFMLWLGDNWYTREADYFSEWGLWNRASRDRSMPVLQNFLKAMPHVAIWDDHDYGPNDIGKNFIHKNISRNIWKNYWCNPSYGENEQGIYTMTSWGDLDLFLLDDRWWRSADRMKDSVDVKPNPDKRMLGKQQMEWLKNGLLYSSAAFKIIAVGSQALNPVSPFDKWENFPVEYEELMHFLSDNKINGVLFLSGDRHHSEIIKVERAGTYPLYDITVSPLTAGTHKFSSAEKNNPYRIFGLDEKQNYGRISITGKWDERRLTVEFIGLKGESLGKWSINEKELKTPVIHN
jgi:alkaline phosphatase D